MNQKKVAYSIILACCTLIFNAGCDEKEARQVEISVKGADKAVLSEVAENVEQGKEIASVVKFPDMSGTNSFYVSNRAPLVPSVYIKLPVKAIKPDGWVGEFLNRQRDGLTGQLGSVSAWLQKEGNAWLAPDGKGAWGWEEVPYWLKGFANLGYILEDKKIIDEALVWIEAALNSQRENGDFGPDQRHGNGDRDYWSNMIMLYCLQSYYEYNSDQRVLDLMSRYFKHQLSVPDENMLTGYWDKMRGGDNIYSIHWLYNRTGEPWLLDLVEKIHRCTADWCMENDLPNWHNVNIAQGFLEPAFYYLQTKEPKHLQAAYNNFTRIRDIYGQVPGGMWGGDENSRAGYDDPRQAVETCGLVEHMQSDERMFALTGDIFWADHCEEVAFNTYTTAFTSDFKALRYLTAPNMVRCDQENHHPGIDNGGPFLMMNPFSSRCCQHNHSHGWPYYAENLWMATPDNGLCAVMFCSNTVTAKVGDGTEVKLVQESNYPFEEDVRITVASEKSVSFPLYIRVPLWCKGATVSLNSQPLAVKPAGGELIKIERMWQKGDVIAYNMPMALTVKTWDKNHNSVSVNYGPLTLSLKIKERYDAYPSDETAIWDSKWQEGVNKSLWPSYEIHADNAWNYGLILDKDNPVRSFTIKKKQWPADNYPFTTGSVPLEVTVKAKRIPQWTIDRYGLCGILQDSPVVSDEPVETITLIPMGAARLRISAFPVIGEGPDANVWVKEEIPSVRCSSCYEKDDPMAVKDGLVPTEQQPDIARHTWWPMKGNKQWLEMDLEGKKSISSVAVFWFDDTGRGQCRVPDSWKLFYRNENDSWQPVSNSQGFDTQVGLFNSAIFDPVLTDSIRIEVKLQENFSGGIYEIMVE
ncbi:MAG: glycoside hydrolase family 127 protein [Sedimentisphaerales bacterium]|nr:glycoside hydrolase family 127 protein [Sedimentisphaerales bacterium]